jgi:hypothetical protein
MQSILYASTKGETFMTIKIAICNYLAQCSDIKKLEPLTLKAYAIDLKQFYEFASLLPT